MSNLREKEDRNLITRLREAVQYCKAENNFQYNCDIEMPAEDRMTMEKCLVQNYLLVHGMDYFGKRDLIYIDMQGDKDVARLDNLNNYVVPDLN